MTNSEKAQESGFQFPLDIEIRAMVDATDDSIGQVVDLMKDYWGDRLIKVTHVLSRNGNWVSVKSYVIAHSREELEQAYAKLKQLPSVKMTL